MRKKGDYRGLLEIGSKGKRKKGEERGGVREEKRGEKRNHLTIFNIPSLLFKTFLYIFAIIHNVVKKSQKQI